MMSLVNSFSISGFVPAAMFDALNAREMNVEADHYKGLTSKMRVREM